MECAKQDHQQVHAEIENLYKLCFVNYENQNSNLKYLRRRESKHGDARKLGAHDTADDVATHLRKGHGCALLTCALS